MEIQKKWAMPSGDTFGIKPIKELFDKYNKGGVIIDPFAKDCKLGTIRNEGICISCGWNTQGIGKCNGAVCKEILIVAHGGSHNDTLVTVDEIKK